MEINIVISAETEEITLLASYCQSTPGTIIGK